MKITRLSRFIVLIPARPQLRAVYSEQSGDVRLDALGFLVVDHCVLDAHERLAERPGDRRQSVAVEPEFHLHDVPPTHGVGLCLEAPDEGFGVHLLPFVTSWRLKRRQLINQIKPSAP